jgi:hypothetical protein
VSTLTHAAASGPYAWRGGSYEVENVIDREMTTGRTVVGLFGSRGEAEATIRELKASGFTDAQIGVATKDEKAGRDPVAGSALGGGLLGGLLGLLGSLLVPGVGPLVVGGVLASTLAGVGVGAATGGIVGALAGMGVPAHDAEHFDQGLRDGGTIVTVDAGPRTREALVLLERHGMDFGPSGMERYGRSYLLGAREPYTGRERRAAPTDGYEGPERRIALGGV